MHSVIYYLLLAYAICSGLIAALGMAFIAKLHFSPPPKTDNASTKLIRLGPDGTGLSRR